VKPRPIITTKAGEMVVTLF